MSIYIERTAPDLGLAPEVRAVYLEDVQRRNRDHRHPKLRKRQKKAIPRDSSDCPSRAAYIDARIGRNRAQVISICDLILATWATREWGIAA